MAHKMRKWDKVMNRIRIRQRNRERQREAQDRRRRALEAARHGDDPV